MPAVRWRGIAVAVLLVAGTATAAAAEPVVIEPEGATTLPAELRPEVVPDPPAETVRAEAALADALTRPEAPAAVTVTPAAGLVHGQQVTVRGTGWPAGHELVGFQCGPEGADPQSCEPNVVTEDEIHRAGPAGNVTLPFPVEVVLDHPTGPIDCRTVTCRVGLLDLWAGRARFVDVAFDPGGPDPARATVTVTPDAGLVDGDLLDIVASGLVGQDIDLAQATFCRAPVTTLADCDRHQWELGELAADGSTEIRHWASAILDLPGGDHDCRAGPCAVLVTPVAFFDDEIELSEAGVADVAFDPGGALRPPPTLTADPATDLVDGDAVELVGSGFDPERGLVIAQCAATATSSRGCVGDVTTFGFTDDGSFDGFFFGVLAKFVDGRGRTVDCRVVACQVVVAHGQFGRHARADLQFDPDAPLLRPTLTVTPSTGLQDRDVVTVTGTDWPSGQPLLLGQCPAGTTDVFECDGDSVDFVWPDEVAVPVARSRAAAEATTFATPFRVRATIFGIDGPVDCRVRACELLADDNTFHRARAAIAFDVAGPVSAGPPFTG